MRSAEKVIYLATQGISFYLSIYLSIDPTLVALIPSLCTHCGKLLHMKTLLVCKQQGRNFTKYLSGRSPLIRVCGLRLLRCVWCAVFSSFVALGASWVALKSLAKRSNRLQPRWAGDSQDYCTVQECSHLLQGFCGGKKIQRKNLLAVKSVRA